MKEKSKIVHAMEGINNANGFTPERFFDLVSVHQKVNEMEINAIVRDMSMDKPIDKEFRKQTDVSLNTLRGCLELKRRYESETGPIEQSIADLIKDFNDA